MWSNIFSDINEGIRHLHVTLFGSFFEVPIDRYQVDEDLYLRLLHYPAHNCPNVILVRGGVFHMSDDASYIKICCNELKDFRVFQMEKYTPLLNYEYARELSKLIKFVKRMYPDNPVYVMGFSMGGIFTLSYLAMGYDEADGYVSISAPMNFDYFNKVISNHFFYIQHKKKITNMYGKDTIEDVIAMFGGDPHFNSSFMQSFEDNLCAHHQKFGGKFISVVGSDDRLAKTFGKDCSKFQQPLATIEIEAGTHCCRDVILYGCACLRSWKNNPGLHSYKVIKKVADEYKVSGLFYGLNL